jgi:mannose-6-phosphate isomerase-like protein (cupin superfamily)
MKPFDIEEYTKQNNNYREVVWTTKTQQLVVMSIPYKESIGLEIHPKTTQFFKFEKGVGDVFINGHVYPVKAGYTAIVDPGLLHNITSRSKNGLKLYTIYSPPQHPVGLIQKKKPKND